MTGITVTVPNLRELARIAGSFVCPTTRLGSREFSYLSELTRLHQRRHLRLHPHPASEIASNTRSNDGYSFTLANANVTSTANGLNQLTTIGGANVTYDARGNVTAIGSTGYGYYAEDRMSVATAISGGYLYFDPASRLSFLYDPADSAGINARQYSGHELVQERTLGGAIRRRYVFGADVDEPLVWYEGTGLTDRRWLHADERGSVVAASDGSGNLVGSINRYDD